MKNDYRCVLHPGICPILLPATALAASHSGHSGWKQLTQADFDKTLTLSGGNYYLGSDVSYPAGSGDITVSGDVTLCLNGHVLNLGYYSIEVGPGANFTLSDCTSARTQGYIDTDGLWKPGATVPAGAMDYDLIGGVITGEKPTDPYYSSHRSVVLDGMYENHTYSVCTFTMEGGNIAGSPGGGVFVSSDSTFNMSGGQIIHNTSNSNVSIYSGGGVYV